MTSCAKQERLALADLLSQIGPDRPTLCEGWTTRDLAAHLVLRERRPDAAGGIVLPALSAYTERVQRKIALRPFENLLTKILVGPPAILRPVDTIMNTVEYFVHNEDIRRAQPGWTPRPPDPTLEDQLWGRLRKMSRFMFRSSPVGVVLNRSDEGAILAKRSGLTVTITGQPSELTLFGFGRGSHANVELVGSPDAVQRLRDTRLGL